MGKPKFLEDADALDYKKRLAEFMQSVNPKDPEKILKALREKYLNSRGESSAK